MQAIKLWAHAASPFCLRAASEGERNGLLNYLDKISVIIPVGPAELAWSALLSDLAILSPEAEIILAGTDKVPMDLLPSPEGTGVYKNIRWIQAPQGRAKQLNAGARSARRPILWFLHADSRLRPHAFVAFERSLGHLTPRDILFFNLSFQSDGPRLMWLNAIGAWFRSRCFALPFGDQGFCLSKDAFAGLGGFDESVAYGEDDLLIRKARRLGFRIRCTGGWIATSARKYQEHGWLRTTLTHLRLTLARTWWTG